MFFALATFGGAKQDLRDVQTFFLFWFLLRNSNFQSLAAAVRRGNFFFADNAFFREFNVSFVESRISSESVQKLGRIGDDLEKL